MSDNDQVFALDDGESVVVHGDGSATITRRTLEGRMLTVTYPRASAHQVIHNMMKAPEFPKQYDIGAILISTPLAEALEVETAELSDETRAEVAEHAMLTGLGLDHGERRAISEQLVILNARRELLMNDLLAEGRNDALDEIEEDIRFWVERVVFLDALLGIANATADAEVEEE
jgi:hypothetical protein